MQIVKLKQMALAALLVLFTAACSNKTNQAEDAQSNPPTQQQGKRPTSQGERPAQQGGGERPSFDQLLSQMDGNKDGKLSQAEVEGPLKNDFSKIDKDKDGFISEAEFKNAPLPRQGRN